MFGGFGQDLLWLKRADILPEKIFVVSIMPCVAKKYECTASEMRSQWFSRTWMWWLTTPDELAQMT